MVFTLHIAQHTYNMFNAEAIHIQNHTGIHLGSEMSHQLHVFCCVFFFLCDNVVQSVRAVFTGSGCDTDDNGSHSAFGARKIHIL